MKIEAYLVELCRQKPSLKIFQLFTTGITRTITLFKHFKQKKTHFHYIKNSFSENIFRHLQFRVYPVAIFSTKLASTRSH